MPKQYQSELLPILLTFTLFFHSYDIWSHLRVVHRPPGGRSARVVVLEPFDSSKWYLFGYSRAREVGGGGAQTDKFVDPFENTDVASISNMLTLWLTAKTRFSQRLDDTSKDNFGANKLCLRFSCRHPTPGPVVAQCDTWDVITVTRCLFTPHQRPYFYPMPFVSHSISINLFASLDIKLIVSLPGIQYVTNGCVCCWLFV